MTLEIFQGLLVYEAVLNIAFILYKLLPIDIVFSHIQTGFSFVFIIRFKDTKYNLIQNIHGVFAENSNGTVNIQCKLIFFEIPFLTRVLILSDIS